MLDKYIAILKAKKLYEVVLGIFAFLIFLLVNRIFTLPIIMLPFLVFIGSRLFLKTKLKAETLPLTNALAIQFTHYLMVLFAAFSQPLTHIIDIFIIFWGTNWFYKKPSWKSGGLMMGYNFYRLFYYVLGFVNAYNQQNVPNMRSAGFIGIISLVAIYYIYAGVKEILNQPPAIEAQLEEEVTPVEEAETE